MNGAILLMYSAFLCDHYTTNHPKSNRFLQTDLSRLRMVPFAMASLMDALKIVELLASHPRKARFSLFSRGDA